MSVTTSEYHPAFDSFIGSVAAQDNDGMLADQKSDYVRRLQNYDERIDELAQVVDFRRQDIDLIGVISGSGGVSYSVPMVGYDFLRVQQTLSRSYISNQIDSAIAELINLRMLRHGWDGYQGLPPSDRSIKDATDFLIKIRKSAPRPIVSASSEGDIELLWESGSRFVNLGFEGSGRLDCYAEKRDSLGCIVEELMFDHVDFREASENMDQVYNWIVSEK